MSDFVNEFWNWYVILIVLVSVIACGVFLWSQSIHHPGSGQTTDTTGHRWDETLEGGLAPNATVMSWQGSAGGIKAAQMGHDVIMAPNTHCYFDFYQTADTKDEPLAIGGCLPVSKVYELEPTAHLTPEQAKQDNIYSGRTDGGCTLASVTKAGNTVRGRLNCTQPPGTADFETTIASPEHFTTRIHMRGAQGDMQADTDARWVAAQCAAPALPSPEAR